MNLKLFLKTFLNSHHGINKRNKVVFENFDDLNYFVDMGAVKRNFANRRIRSLGDIIKSFGDINEADLKKWGEVSNASTGDILFILSGEEDKVRTQLGALRVHVAETLNLKNPEEFKPLWVVDFPLLEKDEETNSYHAMHHPFTSPKIEDLKIPVISAISGAALGGGAELSLCTDFRISSQSLKIGFPETSLGIIPGAGGVFRLPLITGVTTAKI